MNRPPSQIRLPPISRKTRVTPPSALKPLNRNSRETEIYPRQVLDVLEYGPCAGIDPLETKTPESHSKCPSIFAILKSTPPSALNPLRKWTDPPILTLFALSAGIRFRPSNRLLSHSRFPPIVVFVKSAPPSSVAVLRKKALPRMIALFALRACRGPTLINFPLSHARFLPIFAPASTTPPSALKPVVRATKP